MAGTHYSPIPEYELPELKIQFKQKPIEDAINKAQADVMTVIYQDFPTSGGRVVLRASDIAKRLQNQGHTLAASLYGIQKQIFSGELFVLSTIALSDEEWTPWNTVNIFIRSEWGSPENIQSGLLQMIVEKEQRTISRQGFGKVIELEATPIGWFIFEFIFDAQGSEINMDKFKDVYDSINSWDARFTAVNQLNKQLEKIGIKIKKWKFKEISSP